MSKILSVVAPEMFQEVEYLESKRALEEAGHEVVMTSSVKKPTDRQGQVYEADLLLNKVQIEDFDGVTFIGGPGCSVYYDDASAQALAQGFYRAGKLTTAICAAPVILGRAGLLKGKRITSWPGVQDEVKESGADYSGASVTQDGLLITADGPSSARAFGEAVAQGLQETSR